MLSTYQKVATILHLCLAFSLMLWLLFDPFMGEHFRIRSDLLLIENVRGDEALSEKVDPEEKALLVYNRHLWEKLDPKEKQKIQDLEKQLLDQLQAPFWQKLSLAFRNFFFKTSLFALAWIFFSIVICILCLKGKKGAQKAVILLPLIVLLFAIDQASEEQTHAKPLFPTEEEIQHLYLKQPASIDGARYGTTFTEERESLLRGFDLYLIETWAHQTPSTDPEIFKKQKAEGLFAFNLARIQTPPQPSSESSALLLLYLLWNTGLAIILWRTSPS